MKTLWLLFTDYFLGYKNKLLGIFINKPPKNWNEGKKGYILLIPGFSENWICFKLLANELNINGYQIKVFRDYKSFKSIEKTAEDFLNFMNTNKLENFIILAHSKGGIVAKYLLDQHPEIVKKVKKCITIATPWQGTILGNIHILNTHELKPNSKILKDLKRIVDQQKFLNIYPKMDNVIIPNRNLCLEGIENIKIEVIGHTRILNNQQTVKTIIENIDKISL